MKDLSISKLVLTAVVGLASSFAIFKMTDYSFGNILTIIAAITILWSFTFLHTMMGNSAAGSGPIFNRYDRIKGDIRYNIREESGIIKETLIIGLAELALGVLLAYILK